MVYKVCKFHINIFIGVKIINNFISKYKFHAECYAIYEPVTYVSVQLGHGQEDKKKTLCL